MSTQPPTGSQNNDNMDDLFNARPTSGGNSGNMGTPYNPPPLQPNQPNQQRQNPILYIILGLILGVICICGACILITGGSIFAGVNAIAQNPTFKAGVATLQSASGTIQVAAGTGVALMQVPDKLPGDAKDKGTLTAGQQQTGQLATFERQIWHYQAHGGEKITVTASATGGDIALTMGIYDPSGNNVAKTNSPDLTPSLSYVVSGDGSYSILIGGFGNSGEYTIQVSKS